MGKILLWLYFDGYNLNDAVEFIERCYQDKPTDKQIEKAKSTILKQTGKIWN